jgi:hypothetical protein
MQRKYYTVSNNISNKIISVTTDLQRKYFDENKKEY